MSVFDALSRVPKILEANVNSVIHKDKTVKPVTINTTGQKPVNTKEKEIKLHDSVPNYVKQNDVKPKDVSRAVSDLEKELAEESKGNKTMTK